MRKPVQRVPEVVSPRDDGLPAELVDVLHPDVEVEVHCNSERPAQLAALAYAQGEDIHVAPGQGAHLPHEAWHVVQQSQGRVRPASSLSHGIVVNDDGVLEHEADTLGSRAAARSD